MPRLKPACCWCVREVRTAGNKRVLSPVSCVEHAGSMRCSWMADFSYCLLQIWEQDGRRHFIVAFKISRIKFRFPFTASRGLTMGIFAKSLLVSRATSPTLSFSCISWSSPSDGSPLMPLSDVCCRRSRRVASVDL